ncbi:MAG TPA: helical backbone metal receptor [Flavisolibacter sp.]|nr:helical backbone metal receptor [Flavisolibacter sp.]
MFHYRDQLNRLVELKKSPSRIVSLVPSQTELLYSLGLDAEVIGITKFCEQPPEWFRTKLKVGGTKNLDLAKISALRPDLVIASKEENVKEQVEELAQNFPVWISDVSTYAQALEMIESVGAITDRTAAASELIHNIQLCFDHLRASLGAGGPASTRSPRIAYLIWKDPFMAAGGDTFIGDMLRLAGFVNIFEQKTRYPIVSIEELREANCELIFLSSEPYPFAQKHIPAFSDHLPATKVMLVDGMLFSWYGSRLEKAPGYFIELHRQINLNN